MKSKLKKVCVKIKNALKTDHKKRKIRKIRKYLSRSIAETGDIVHNQQY